MKKTIDGNTAAAHIAYKVNELAAIYPITPSSTMSEVVDAWSAKGEKNIFNQTVKVLQMQSEAGASATMHGALSTGTLATTFTSSQGLLLMVPNMYKIAGELLPNVIHVAARTIATHALSIFGDHSDVMAVRQTGYAMLCSSTVQECHDFALASHIATLKSSVPFVHFFDGFRTSHEINTVEIISDENIKQIYPFEEVSKFRLRGLNSSHPHQQGTAQNSDTFFQNREASNIYYNQTPELVKQTLNDIYKVTGRKYNLFDYYGSDNPEHIIVMMGSGATTSQATIDFLNKKGSNYGLIKVRLYRPFSILDFANAIPSSTKTITVLDRTKEPGSAGEPLYQDVLTAIFETGKTNIKVLCGRYGLSSKEFTPTMVQSVFENAENTQGQKNHFTVGINDDITFNSLPLTQHELITCEGRMESFKFYGFGGDGTVSASKSAIKILSDNTDMYGQAYFEYDSKKSGNTTISHLRFSKEPINECYLTNNINFVAVNNQVYLNKLNVVKNLKQNGTLLVNTLYSPQDLERIMPDSLKKYIAVNKIKVYTIDAYSLAIKHHLGTKINLIMQTAFFKLSNLIDFNIAKNEIKKHAKNSYAKSNEEELQNNFNAIDETKSNINEFNYPQDWSKLTESKFETAITDFGEEYYQKIIKPINALEGNTLPVSAFNPAGVVPTNTAKFEKRGIATTLPCWIGENCIQCNLCSFVCPHSAIRSHLVKNENIQNAPETFKTLNATAEPDKQFKIQLNPLDCTGCGVCESICPVKQKALVMKNTTEVFDEQQQNYEFMQTLKQEKSSIFGKNTVKGLGFYDPYFEFSGACAGCGETPYIKVLTQLFGDKMIMANATGCSSIYGGSSPACPYTTDENGNGVAWANSLFEDNAEFGLGIKLGAERKQQLLIEKLNQLLSLNLNDKLNEFIVEYLNTTNTDKQRELGNIITNIITARNNVVPQSILTDILLLKDSFVTQSVWIVGGDGWAYDIGYGGLDHVLASKQNVNILVLDTEVYSNTGGQASKSTPLGAIAKFASLGKNSRKKDLAQIATMYKDVYVAKISMGANPNHVIKVLQEAESYDGVSLIIAYCPCIAHGINMSESQSNMKLAVETGYWHLWRYNPVLREKGENPFVLDSPAPTKPISEFLMNEQRFNTLFKKDKDFAEEVFKLSQQEVDEKYLQLKKLAGK